MRALLVVLLLCASCEQSKQHAPQCPDLVDPIIIVSSDWYTDGGTQVFVLIDAVGKKETISIDGRVFSDTPGRIHVGSHPDHGRLTTMAEERAYIDLLKRAVDIKLPAQCAYTQAQYDSIEKTIGESPRGGFSRHTIEKAYAAATEFLARRHE